MDEDFFKIPPIQANIPKNNEKHDSSLDFFGAPASHTNKHYDGKLFMSLKRQNFLHTKTTSFDIGAPEISSRKLINSTIEKSLLPEEEKKVMKDLDYQMRGHLKLLKD